MRRVQISCDICTRFAHYLYSTKQCWIIKAEKIKIFSIGGVPKIILIVSSLSSLNLLKLHKSLPPLMHNILDTCMRCGPRCYVSSMG